MTRDGKNEREAPSNGEREREGSKKRERPSKGEGCESDRVMARNSKEERERVRGAM